MSVESDGQMNSSLEGSISLHAQVVDLRQQLAQRDALIETLHMGMALFSPDLEITWANPQLRSMFDWDEPVGKKCYEFFQEKDDVCEDCGAYRAFASGRTVECVKWHVKNKRFYRIRSCPVIDPVTGIAQSVLQTIMDVTDRHRLEEELLLAQFAIEHCSDMMFRVTPDALFAYANKAASDVLGYTRQEFESLHVYDLDSAYPAAQ